MLTPKFERYHKVLTLEQEQRERLPCGPKAWLDGMLNVPGVA